MIRAALLAGVLALGVAAPGIGAERADTAHPLLDLARERQARQYEGPRPSPAGIDSREALHAVEQAHVPDDAACARSVGAPRFAELHAEVGIALSGQGDLPGAAAAYRRAIACRPRDADLHTALAGVLFDLRDLAGAQAAMDVALNLEPRSVSAARIAANLDFVAERWPAAIGRFRYVASSDPDRTHASYGQLMFWLAQARAGVRNPEWVARTPVEGWPQPLLLYLRGEYSETELLEPIRDGDDEDNDQPNTSTDERLAEALYYVGQARWARGEREVALDYFTALVNLRVTYFLEHGLAIAEIAKLR